MSQWKNEKNTWLTNALFLETCVIDDRTNIRYTLQDEDVTVDGVTYPSLKRLYLEMEDPTEYLFATEYLGGWKHWKKIATSVKIRDLVEDWREELEVMLRAKGIINVRKQAYNGNYSASKWLADKGWDPKLPAKRGAPSTEEKMAEVRKAAKVVDIVDHHFERMKRKER